MKITNHAGLPEPIVRAVSKDYKPKPCRISVTQIINAPRQVQLSRRYWDMLTEDAADRVWALLGEAAHAILEKGAGLDDLSEERLACEVNGWTLSGRADLLDSAGILNDYKVTSVWAVLNGVKAEWEAQLNVYAAMYRRTGFGVNGLQIVAIMRDWAKRRAGEGGNYPDTAVKVIPVRLWTPEEAESYIAARIAAHQAAEDLADGELPECTPDERWERPTTYAVMKAGNKRALRVFDNPEEAEALAAEKGKGFTVEVRPGVSARCQEYCAVADFCEFGRMAKGGQPLEAAA